MEFLTIEPNVPMPLSRFGATYAPKPLPDISHLESMKIGDSVLCESRAERKRVFVFMKKKGLVAETRRDGKHYRVWRTA